MLEDSLWHTGLIERCLKPLGAQRRLRGVLEQDGVPRGQSRNDAVDCGQIGVVPGGDDEDHAHGLMPYETGEPVLRLGPPVSQRLRRHFQHVAGPLLQATNLSRALHNRPAHLRCDLGRELLATLDHVVDHPAEQRDPRLRRHASPALRRGTGPLQGDRNFRVSGEGPLDEYLPVHRRDGALHCHGGRGQNALPIAPVNGRRCRLHAGPPSRAPSRRAGSSPRRLCSLLPPSGDPRRRASAESGAGSSPP